MEILTPEIEERINTPFIDIWTLSMKTVFTKDVLLNRDGVVELDVYAEYGCFICKVYFINQFRKLVCHTKAESSLVVLKDANINALWKEFDDRLFKHFNNLLQTGDVDENKFPVKLKDYAITSTVIKL